jgi:cytochrome P450
VVSRHSDVVRVLRDAGLFASGHGNVVDTLTKDGDSGAGVMLPVTDGHRHRAIRRLTARGLNAHAVRSAQAGVRANARRLIRDVVDSGDCDFGALAGQIPAAAVCGLLGAPPADHPYLTELARNVLGSSTPNGSMMDMRMARTEILGYFAALLAKRRREPRDDLVSLIAHGGSHGVELSDMEVAMNCYSLLFGGLETTRLTLTTGVLALAQQPHEWSRLRQGEVSVSTAVEEILRWTSAAMHLGRSATRGTEFGGEHIRAGDVVTVWNRSANFDGASFDRPDSLDLSRAPNHHLAFGFGAHFCLGAALARMELECFFEALRDMVTVIEVRGETSPIYSNFLFGIDRLPVSFRPAGRPAELS